MKLISEPTLRPTLPCLFFGVLVQKNETIILFQDSFVKWLHIKSFEPWTFFFFFFFCSHPMDFFPPKKSVKQLIKKRPYVSVSFFPPPSVGVNDVSSRTFTGVPLCGGLLIATSISWSPIFSPSVFITAFAASCYNQKRFHVKSLDFFMYARYICDLQHFLVRT